MESIKYNKQYESLLLQYISRKDLDRYENKGKYRLLSLLGIYHSDFYVLVDKREVIGFVLIRTKLSRKYPKASWIYDVFVKPEYRGKGYSKELMRLAIAKCTYPHVYLYVHENNTVALNLYKRIGFYEVGELKEEKLLRYDKV